MGKHFTKKVANSAGRSKLKFQDEVEKTLKSYSSCYETIMEVKRHDGTVHVLKPAINIPTRGLASGDIADCPGLGMGVRECEILRFAETFYGNIIRYHDETHGLSQGGGSIKWEEILEVVGKDE